MESFYVIAREESEYWNPAVFEEHGIRAAFGLYLIRAGEATHCCSLTPSSWVEWVGNRFILADDAPRDSWGEWTGQDLENESGGETGQYLDYLDPGKMDARFVAELVEIAPGEVEAATDGPDALRAALWDAAREAFNENPDEPGILDAETFDRWQEEQAEARRAENRPPLDRRAQLPLFAAAWGKMQEAHPAWGANVEGYQQEVAALRALHWY